MSKVKTFGFDTLSLHAGQQPDPATGARATPIYQTASYVFKSPDHAASLFNVERAGHVYSRITNPTTAVLEERIAALEGGIGAIATASGQAACHLAIATLLSAGEHIVASRSLYGGTHNLLEYTLPRFGITTTFVDPRDPDAFAAAITPQTRLLFGETLGNPGLEVLNIPAISEVAHAHGLPLMIDSTFTTPYLCQPFSLGADLIFHSATKFLSGHGVIIGGLVVDSGTFDWAGRLLRFSPNIKRWSGSAIQSVRIIRTTNLPSNCCPRGVVRFSVSVSKAGAKRVSVLSAASNYCLILPMWETPNHWSFILPAQHTIEWMPRLWLQPASRKD
jgi:O-acetylhomoserine (thiol)-lyase